MITEQEDKDFSLVKTGDEAAGAKGHALSDITVIIPCAGEPNESLVPLTGKTSSALTPLDGKPVIYWTLKYLRDLGFANFVVPVRKQDSFLCRFIQEVFGNQASFEFPVPEFNGELGYTLLCCAPLVKTSKALVVLGDTFFEFPREELVRVEQSYVLVHPVEDVSRWCLAELTPTGKVARLVDKPPQYVGNPLALIGVYAIAQWADFATLLTQHWAQKSAEGKKGLPLTEVLEAYQEKEPMQAVSTERWFDCGHADKLLQSQRRLLQTRSFNSIKFDELRGTVTKQSHNREKFLDEIQYYSLLPKELLVFFPRVLTANTAWDEMSLTLEYYGYPTLAETLLFEKLDPRIWRAVFEHLLNIRKEFDKFSIEARPSDAVKMYRYQILERVERLRQQGGSLTELLKQPAITLNGRELLGFEQTFARLAGAIDRLTKTAHARIIHGDMCFSNILYDLNGRVCKLIDPRGSFGDKGIYGDPRYDVAKLYHSVHGNYDFIVNDLFQLSVKENDITLHIAAGEHVKLVREQFENVFFAEFERQEIQLIEGLLFVGMGVFHKDVPTRQMAMLLTGLNILNEIGDAA